MLVLGAIGDDHKPWWLGGCRGQKNIFLEPFFFGGCWIFSGEGTGRDSWVNLNCPHVLADLYIKFCPMVSVSQSKLGEVDVNQEATRYRYYCNCRSGYKVALKREMICPYSPSEMEFWSGRRYPYKLIPHQFDQFEQDSNWPSKQP